MRIMLIAFSMAILLCHNTYAQEVNDKYTLGYHYDYLKNPINGYYASDYNPEVDLKITYEIGKGFSPGYYFDTNGEKHEGYIHRVSRSDFVEYRKSEFGDIDKIKAKDCAGFVIGVDSFTVVSDFRIYGSIGYRTRSKPSFAQYIETIGDNSFLKHIDVGNRVVSTYLVGTDGSHSFESFPNNQKKFKEMAALYFSDFPALMDAIDEKELTQEDIPSIIKMYQYRLYYNAGKPILYDKYWDETKDENEAEYFASINSIEGINFNLTYRHKNGTTISNCIFSSFYPHEAQGIFTWYKPDSSIRKQIEYHDNEEKAQVTYHHNGQKMLISHQGEYDRTYTQVFDLDGKLVLDSYGNGEINFRDSIQQRTLHYVFTNHKLESISYREDDKNIYLVSERNTSLKHKKRHNEKLQQLAGYKLSDIQEYAHGLILLKARVSPKGIVTDISLLKGLRTNIDEKVMRYAQSFLGEKEMKPGKNNGEKIWQEVIIPIDYSLQGYSHYRNYNNTFWMHDMMFQQQMHLNHISPPAYIGN